MLSQHLWRCVIKVIGPESWQEELDRVIEDYCDAAPTVIQNAHESVRWKSISGSQLTPIGKCTTVLEHQMSVGQRLVALFRLDFRSAFGSAPSLPRPESAVEENEQTALPFELEVQKLDYIRYRRKILDWRDEFAVQMLIQGKESFLQFAEHVEKESDGVGILRKLFAKPAAEVLEDDFFSLVRAPLVERAKTAESELAKVVQFLPPEKLSSVNLVVEELDPFLTVLGDLRFRPSNQDELLAKLNNLVFGELGIVDCYLQRSQAVSQALLQTLDAKS